MGFPLQEIQNEQLRTKYSRLLFGEAATASADKFATSLQTIASAHADFAKKLMQHASEFTSQLTSVKEPAKLMELQSEYAKNAYETFVAEAKWAAAFPRIRSL